MASSAMCYLTGNSCTPVRAARQASSAMRQASSTAGRCESTVHRCLWHALPHWDLMHPSGSRTAGEYSEYYSSRRAGSHLNSGQRITAALPCQPWTHGTSRISMGWGLNANSVQTRNRDPALYALRRLQGHTARTLPTPAIPCTNQVPCIKQHLITCRAACRTARRTAVHAGLYRTPVATLDFASLYPSLYRAHNLCYTTLLHPDDVKHVGRERCNWTPSGHAFVKHEVRREGKGREGSGGQPQGGMDGSRVAEGPGVPTVHPDNKMDGGRKGCNWTPSGRADVRHQLS